jgi:hypothetical protein
MRYPLRSCVQLHVHSKLRDYISLRHPLRSYIQLHFHSKLCINAKLCGHI